MHYVVARCFSSENGLHFVGQLVANGLRLVLAVEEAVSIEEVGCGASEGRRSLDFFGCFLLRQNGVEEGVHFLFVLLFFVFVLVFVLSKLHLAMARSLGHIRAGATLLARSLVEFAFDGRGFGVELVPAGAGDERHWNFGVLLDAHLVHEVLFGGHEQNQLPVVLLLR